MTTNTPAPLVYIPRIRRLHGWGGEQVMSLHPCVTLQRYRNARFSIRDTAYWAVLRDAQLYAPKTQRRPLVEVLERQMVAEDGIEPSEAGL